MMDDLKAILESLVFVSEEPLSIQRLADLLENVDRQEIRQALSELAAEHANRPGGILLMEVAGGFQFRTRAEYNAWIKKLLKPSPSKLSRAALETLAIIAYKQPITRADIEQIRGVDCGGVLRMLLEKKLIRVLGRKEIVGRPMLYGTTREFLEVFNLKDLRDLPSPKEIASLGEADGEAFEDESETGPPLTPAAVTQASDKGPMAVAASLPVPEPPATESNPSNAAGDDAPNRETSDEALDAAGSSVALQGEMSQSETGPAPSEESAQDRPHPTAPSLSKEETSHHAPRQNTATDNAKPDQPEAPDDGKNA